MGIPKVRGFIRLSGGSMGETTFMKTASGYKAKDKLVVNKNNWKNGSNFARCRENAGNFGTGSKLCKLLKNSVAQLLFQRKDHRMFLRLKQLIAKVQRLDTTNTRGKATITMEAAPQLIGFEMNSTCSLKSVFNSRYSINANRETGEISIQIPSFLPADRILAPRGATHFQLVSAAAAFDFEKMTEVGNIYKSTKFALGDERVEDITMTHSLPAGSKLPVFIFLGVNFTQELNGKTYQVANRKQNPLCIIDINII